MTVNLTKHKDALLSAWKDVVNEKTVTDWALFGYEKQSNDLYVVETGDGGLEELTDELNSGKIMYAFVRVTCPNSGLPKFVFINWQGEGAPLTRKGACANHVLDVSNFFKGAHISINARMEEDIEPSLVLEKVSKASASTFNFKDRSDPIENVAPVGSVYKRIRPTAEINPAEREKFWIKEQEEEKRRIVEERKKLDDERRKEAEAQKERDIRDSSARDEWVKERSRSINKMREAERNADNVAKSLEEKLQWEKQLEMDAQDERERRQKNEHLRRERSHEAQSLISQRKINAKAVFEQNTCAGQMSSIQQPRQAKVLQAFEEQEHQIEVRQKHEQEVKEQEIRQEQKIREEQEIRQQQKIREEQEIRQQQKIREEQEIRQQQKIREEQEIRQQQKIREEQEIKQQKIREEQEIRQQQKIREEQEIRQQQKIREEQEIRQQQKIREEQEIQKQKIREEQEIRQQQKIREEQEIIQEQKIRQEQEILQQKIKQEQEIRQEQKIRQEIRAQLLLQSSNNNINNNILEDPVPKPEPKSEPKVTAASPPEDFSYTRNLLKEGLPERTDSELEPNAEEEEQNWDEPTLEAPPDVRDPLAEMMAEHGIVRPAVEDTQVITAQSYTNALSSDGLRARALYDYQAADDTEISFDPDDIITQIEQIDEGWWQGLGPDGSYGLFPANYVELLGS